MKIELIIIRYLDGTSTFEEKSALLAWLRNSESNRTDFLRTRDIWISSTAACLSEVEVDIALEKFRALLMKIQQTDKKRLPVSVPQFVKIAAAILLLLLGSGNIYYFTRSEHSTTVHSVYITSPATKGFFTLPDGSQVWLNTNSRLTLNEELFSQNRSVQLEGEGFFKIVKDKKYPFKVSMNEIHIEVLGTSFNACNYPHSQRIETTLSTGSIKLSGKALKTDQILRQGDRFVYNKQNYSTSTSHVNPAYFSVWKENSLVFEDERMTNIITCLEVWYKRPIRCSDPLIHNIRLSFTVKDESMEEILKAISLIAHVDYTVDNYGVTLTSRKQP